VTRGERLLEDAPQGASRWVTRLLHRRGIRLVTATRVTGHAAGGALVQRDETIEGEDSLDLIEADHVIHATGLMPPPVIERLGLPVIPGRGLAIRGQHWWGGCLALVWKNVLDRRFLARYRWKPGKS
jgi:NADH dehydrogenase FAD-containing subunit